MNFIYNLNTKYIFILPIFSITQLISIVYSPGIVNYLGRKIILINFTLIQTIVIFFYSFINFFRGGLFFFIAFLVRALHGFSDGALILIVFGTTNNISKGPNLQNALGNLELMGMFGTASAHLIVSIFFHIGGYSLPFIITTIVSSIAVFFLLKNDFNIKEENINDNNNNINTNNNKNSSILPYTIGQNTSIKLILAIINFNGQYYFYPTLTDYLNKSFGTSIEICSIFFIFPSITYWLCLLCNKKITDYLSVKFTILISLFFTIIGCFLISPPHGFLFSCLTVAVGLFIQGFGQPFINIPLMWKAIIS